MHVGGWEKYGIEQRKGVVFRLEELIVRAYSSQEFRFSLPTGHTFGSESDNLNAAEYDSGEVFFNTAEPSWNKVHPVMRYTAHELRHYFIQQLIQAFLRGRLKKSSRLYTQAGYFARLRDGAGNKIYIRPTQNWSAYNNHPEEVDCRKAEKAVTCLYEELKRRCVRTYSCHEVGPEFQPRLLMPRYLSQPYLPAARLKGVLNHRYVKSLMSH